MKYISKEQVIVAAQEAGSTANTFRGAAKFLAKKPAMSLEKRAGNLDRYGNRIKRTGTKRDYGYNKRADAIMNALNLPVYSEVKGYADELSSPLLKVASVAIKDICNAGHYRRSNSSWAGGSHSVECSLSRKARAAGGSERAWSNNGKWTGTNSYMLIEVKWETLLLFPTLILPDTDVIVIDAQMTELSDVLKVTVLEQGRGFDVNPATKWYVPGKGVYGSLKMATSQAGNQRQAA